ncbi:serine protease inhibitor, Kazal-type family protein [Salix suchowensis]|nr:serine protease inhibitor, Kazal-type family protein [Salix suchowensis]
MTMMRAENGVEDPLSPPTLSSAFGQSSLWRERFTGVDVAKKGFCEVGNNGVASQSLLLVHIAWLIVLGFSILFGLL